MTQITFETHGHGAAATTTIDLPAWAPPIFDASTGADSDMLCWVATTSGGKMESGDGCVPLPINLKTFSAAKVRLADNSTGGIPVAVTLKYLTTNELVRT